MISQRELTQIKTFKIRGWHINMETTRELNDRSSPTTDHTGPFAGESAVLTTGRPENSLKALLNQLSFETHKLRNF